MSRISIIIRTKNEGAFIGETLHSLFRQKVGYPVEVIIVDSGSTDGTLDILSLYDVKVIKIPSSIFTYGYSLNSGIKESRGDIICSLSAHCVPTDSQWLSELTAPIMEGRAHATYGKQVSIEGLNPFEEVSLEKHFPAERIKPGRVPFSNANCAFLREMWEKVAFDETLPSWEDYLWYLLLRDSFTFQYCPDASVYHTHSFSLQRIAKRTFDDGKAFRLFKDRYGFDVLNDIYPTMKDKAALFVNDFTGHIRFFMKKGYKKYILLLPFVKLYTYWAYWKGYKSFE
jgi:glycosyltransferase involved in cell wall biosynthesis